MATKQSSLLTVTFVFHDLEQTWEVLVAGVDEESHALIVFNSVIKTIQLNPPNIQTTKAIKLINITNTETVFRINIEQ